MGKVIIFAAFVAVIAGVAIFGLIYTKVAQKMFSNKKNNKQNGQINK